MIACSINLHIYINKNIYSVQSGLKKHFWLYYSNFACSGPEGGIIRKTETHSHLQSAHTIHNAVYTLSAIFKLLDSRSVAARIHLIIVETSTPSTSSSGHYEKGWVAEFHY